MRDIVRHLHYGVRQLIRHPFFTIVTLFTLALGIGLTTAIFSFIDAVVIHPLNYPRSDELVAISQRSEIEGRTLQAGVSAPNVLDIQKESDIFEEVAYFHWQRPVLGMANPPKQLLGVSGSTNLLHLLGVQLLFGPGFPTESEIVSRGNMAVLTYGFWQSQFAGDRNIIGQTIELGGEKFEIVGVTPKTFRFLYDSPVDVIMPLVLGPQELSDKQRSVRDLNTFGRMKPGFTLKQAQAEMDTIARRLQSAYPEANKGWDFYVVSLRSRYLGPTRERAVGAVAIASFLVFLIACTNVSSLLLVRATGRAREVAVRTALGANHRHLFSQFVTEGILLGVLGGLISLPVSLAGIKLLTDLCAQYYSIPGTRQIALNGVTVAFCIFVSLICGVVFGGSFAIRSRNLDVTNSLKDGAPAASTGVSVRRIRKVFVIGEITLTVMLVSVTGLLVLSFINLLNADLGLDPRNVLHFYINLPVSKYPTGQRKAVFFESALERFRHLPGVESASAYIPVDRLQFAPGGQSSAPSGHDASATVYVILPGFINTVRATLIRGREFTEKDNAGAPPVGIINETLARRYFPNANPVGMYIKPLKNMNIYSASPILDRDVEIVGVVKNVRMMGAQDDAAKMYLPYPQYPASSGMAICIRTTAPHMDSISAIREAVMSVDREQPVIGFQTLEESIVEWYGVRFPMIVMGVFAGVSLFLSAVAIFGVVSFSVAQRTKEIGIRIALGARRRHILTLVLREVLALTAQGVALGIALSFAASHTLASFLYGVGTYDLRTPATVAFIMAAVTIIAAVGPAYRATLTAPMLAIRRE
jgi:putative ABC transport system permease protein